MTALASSRSVTVIPVDEVDVPGWAPILRRYLSLAPGARPHFPVDRRAPLVEFDRIAARYPVFRITTNRSGAEGCARRRVDGLADRAGKQRYAEGGERSCEIGTVMFGRGADGTEHPARMDLVRLAVPRRTYTQSHIDYVIEVVERVAAKAADLTGMEITYQQQRLRHFTARFRPLG
jgi:hypothetical protein